MVKDLLPPRRFAPLFLTQFLAALNDNFLKQSLVLLCLFKIGGATGAMPGTIAGAVLIAPFFPFSAFAGVPSAILPVERLPILGTGKVDYVGAAELVRARLSPVAEAA